MELLKKNKNSIIVLAVLVVGFLLYQFVFKAEEPLVTSDVSSTSEILGQDLVNELQRLRGLRNINTAFFAEPAFTGLYDIEVPITPKPAGRQNPFLPAGQ